MDVSLSEFVTRAGFSVASVLVIKDQFTGRARGFGFVELSNGEDLERAVSSLNGQSIEGRSLVVSEARPQQQRSGFSEQRERRGRDRGNYRRNY